MQHLIVAQWNETLFEMHALEKATVGVTVEAETVENVMGKATAVMAATEDATTGVSSDLPPRAVPSDT